MWSVRASCCDVGDSLRQGRCGVRDSCRRVAGELVLGQPSTLCSPPDYDMVA